MSAHRHLLARFSTHIPSDQGAEDIASMRSVALIMAEFIDQAMPDCREKSMAWSKLEEAVFWANAGIARQTAAKEEA
jgi:hypothetical protein